VVWMRQQNNTENRDDDQEKEKSKEVQQKEKWQWKNENGNMMMKKGSSNKEEWWGKEVPSFVLQNTTQEIHEMKWEKTKSRERKQQRQWSENKMNEKVIQSGKGNKCQNNEGQWNEGQWKRMRKMNWIKLKWKTQTMAQCHSKNKKLKSECGRNEFATNKEICNAKEWSREKKNAKENETREKHMNIEGSSHGVHFDCDWQKNIEDRTNNQEQWKVKGSFPMKNGSGVVQLRFVCQCCWFCCQQKTGMTIGQWVSSVALKNMKLEWERAVLKR